MIHCERSEAIWPETCLHLGNQRLTVMKKLIGFPSLVILLSSCVYYDVEPRYDRDRFIGFYDVEEYSQTYGDMTYYEMRITRARHTHEVYLDNIYLEGLRVYAKVDYNRIRIPLQVVNGYEIEGSGNIHRNELRLDYRVTDLYSHDPTDFCEVVAWR